jgi:hypothetical protein
LHCGTVVVPYAAISKKRAQPGKSLPEGKEKLTRYALKRGSGKRRMTRQETLLLLVRQAMANGFEFRQWFQSHILPEWPGVEEAVRILMTEGRLQGLLFSHTFARAFWKQGAQMNFLVPGATYERLNGKGEVVTITRKPFTRRTIKADVWKYHLRQMAVSEDPLRYLKRFLPTHEELSAPETFSALG